MDRRSFLTSLALGLLPSRPGEPADPSLLLQQRLSVALAATSPEAPWAPGVLADKLSLATAAFDRCQYLALAEQLPGLVVAAGHAPEDQSDESATASAIYHLAARVAGKLPLTTGLAPIAAERAVLAAERSGDRLVVAASSAVLASATRRAGDPHRAQQISLRAAEGLRLRDTAAIREAVQLYCGAGYAAALAGDASRSDDLYREARLTGGLAETDTLKVQLTAYSDAHQISAALKMDDAAAALGHARRVPLSALPTHERVARLLVDCAQARFQFGHRELAYKLLQTAYDVAPEEVRTRDAARRLAAALLGEGTQI